MRQIQRCQIGTMSEYEIGSHDTPKRNGREFDRFQCSATIEHLASIGHLFQSESLGQSDCFNVRAFAEHCHCVCQAIACKAAYIERCQLFIPGEHFRHIRYFFRVETGQVNRFHQGLEKHAGHICIGSSGLSLSGK